MSEAKPKETKTKIIFESVRNTVTCATLAVSGLAVSKFKEISILGPAYATGVGLSITLVSAVLVLWNVPHTYRSIRSQANPRRASFWLLDAPAIFLYMLFTISVWGSIAKLQAQQFSKIAVSEHSHATQTNPKSPS